MSSAGPASLSLLRRLIIDGLALNLLCGQTDQSRERSSRLRANFWLGSVTAIRTAIRIMLMVDSEPQLTVISGCLDSFFLAASRLAVAI